MKKIGIKIGFSLIAVLCVLLLWPGRVQAVDVSRDCSLTISSVCDGVVLQGAGFRVYHLADRTEEYRSFTARERFKGYPVNLNAGSQTEWVAVAETLRGCIESDGLEPDYTGTADEHGVTMFQNLKCGLYLVICEDVTVNGVHYSAPCYCVALPDKDKTNDEYIYSVLSKPKYKGKGQETEFVDIGVVKMWKDTGYEKLRPKEITIVLNRDGKPAEKVTLSNANNWKYAWKDLPANSSYSVSEEPVNGYTCAVERKDNAFIVTNTIKPTIPEKPTEKPQTPGNRLPQTGQLWWPVIAFGCSGLVMTLLGLLLRRVRRDV